MKKLFTAIILIILVSGVTKASGSIIEIKGQYFYPTEKAFRDIYSGGLMYGGEISIGIWKNFGIWFGGSYFSKKGKLTFTKEETKLQIMPIGGGLKCRGSIGAFNFYVDLGLDYYQFKESNPIGDVNKNGLGYVGKIGSYIKLKGGLLIDLYADYSSCKIKPVDIKIDIGGFAVGIGLGYEF